MYPPRMVPSTTKRFQRCSFQLKRKNSLYFPAPQMAQKVLRFEDIPKFLPTSNSISMISAIAAPETYQGQGSIIQSILLI